jgi:hypothetical protein
MPFNHLFPRAYSLSPVDLIPPDRPDEEDDADEEPLGMPPMTLGALLQVLQAKGGVLCD